MSANPRGAITIHAIQYARDLTTLMFENSFVSKKYPVPWGPLYWVAHCNNVKLISSRNNLPIIHNASPAYQSRLCLLEQRSNREYHWLYNSGVANRAAVNSPELFMWCLTKVITRSNGWCNTQQRLSGSREFWLVSTTTVKNKLYVGNQKWHNCAHHCLPICA